MDLKQNDVDLEEVLSQFKLLGSFYLKLLMLSMFVIVSNEMFFFNFIFGAVDVKYWCKYNCQGDSRAFGNMVRTKAGEDHRCYKFNLKQEGGSCSVDNLDTSQQFLCNKWEYEDPLSFVSEFNLGCQDWKRTFIGTVHMLGVLFGQCLVGTVSDRIGRKKVIIGTTLIAGVAGLTKTCISSYWPYLIIELLEGVFGDSCVVTFTYAIESASIKSRVKINAIVQSTFGATDIIIAILAWSISYWRHYLRTIYSLAGLFISYCWIMDESVRWLLCNGQKQKAIAILKKAAERDKIYIDDDLLNRLKGSDEIHTSGKNVFKQLRLTLKSKTLLWRLVGSICMWTTCNFTIISLVINSVSLEGNKFLNYAITGSMYVMSSMSLIYILSRFKRKKPLLISFTLTGVFCVAQILLPKGHPWTRAILYYLGTLAAAFTAPSIYLYTLEIFPTYIRSTMQAICSSSGKIGALLAPQTPLLLRIWPGLPILIIAVASMASAVITLFMPDTSNEPLPDTVDEAEALGSRQSSIESRSS